MTQPIVGIDTPEVQKRIDEPQFPVPTELNWIRPPRLAEDQEFDFILPGLCRGEVGILAGAGGGGKSFLALEIAYSVACGVRLIHHASKGAVLNGQAEIQQATRGASALVDSSRLTMTLLRDTTTKEILLSYPKINGHAPLDTAKLIRNERGLLIEEITIPEPKATKANVLPF